MALKKYKPITPTLRFKVNTSFEELTKKEPEKSLLVPLKSKAGRNNTGRITVRRRGGGHKRKYRIIDFKRDKFDIPAEVIALEYDPNRSARIALLKYQDGEKRYILAPLNIKIGDIVISSDDADIKVGNSLTLEKIPLGTVIHNIELKPGKGGQLARSAGSYAEIVAKEGNYAHIKLPSSEVRLVRLDCRATIGQVGNIEHEGIVIGKAGKSRWLGRRPKVRGVAMNPIDHPHGGGEGKAPQGNPHPVTPWGKPTKGAKTRKKKNPTNKYILKRRSK